jgi:cobalt-zinc-cadmium efflux system membrane fusion protein
VLVIHRARVVAQLIALAVIALAGCGKSEPQAAAGSSPAQSAAQSHDLKLSESSRKFLVIEPVGGADNAYARTYFGRTAFRPKALSAVTALFAGRVASVAVEPGQAVKAGQTLFVIDSADVLAARTTLDQARLRLRLAEEVLSRQTEMVQRGVGLEVERFDADMKVREAKSELERAQRNAALAGPGEGTKVQVRSPVSGIVVTVKATAGATVQPGGDALVEVGDPKALWIVADAPEGEADLVAKATRAEVSIAALNFKLAGRVAGIAPKSDAETRRTPFYVELEKRPEELRAGMLAQVALSGISGEAQLTLPVTAVLLKEGGRRIVYVEEPSGRFVARNVDVGDERGGRVRVLKGLQPGERVVMRGALLVDREAEQLL